MSPCCARSMPRRARNCARPKSAPGMARMTPKTNIAAHAAANSDRPIFNHMVERLDDVFAAISDPTRRAILAGLADREMTISEIAEPFDMSFYAVSKHVRVLENAGLILRDVRGREHHCSLNPEPLREAGAWIENYRTFWEQRL